MEKKTQILRVLLSICVLGLMLVQAGKPLHPVKAATNGIPFIVDSFQDAGSTSLSVNSNTSTNQSFTTAAAIGGYRNAKVTRTAGTGAAAYTMRTDTAGHFSVSAEASVLGNTTLTYDGTTNSAVRGYNLGGGAGIDLTANGNDEIYFDILSSDFVHTIRVTVYTSSTSCSRLTKSTPAGFSEYNTPTALLFLYTDFTRPAGCTTEATFAQIKAIEIYITTNQPSGDLLVEETGVSTTDYGDAWGDAQYYFGSFTAIGHIVDPTQPILGSAADGEAYSLATPGADGDDLDNLDDEDGVFLSNQPWVKGGASGGMITVDMTAGSGLTGETGCLWGWIDWDNDGWFDNIATAVDSEGQDLVINAYQLSPGRTSIPIIVPALADDYVYARFRLFPVDHTTGTCTNNLGNTDIFPDTGVVVGGEVEDYYWQINKTTAVDVANFQTGLSAPLGISVQWTTISEADTVGFNIFRAGSNGVYTQLNANLIPAQTSGAPTGNAYVFTDSSALPGVTYSYKLQLVDAKLNATDFGVVNGSYFVAHLPLVRH